MYVAHLLYPFPCWWTFKLLPCPDYSTAVNIGVHVCFFGSWLLLGSGRKLGRVVLNQSSLEENGNSELWRFLVGTKCGQFAVAKVCEIVFLPADSEY